MHRRTLIGFLAFLAACSSIATDDSQSALDAAATENSLLRASVMPAETYAVGPASGSRIAPAGANGVTLPFATQPVQGVSAMIKNDDGTFSALLDNGYGAMESSADFLLRIYRIRTNAVKGTALGGVEVIDFVTLHDPDKKLPWTIVNHFTDARELTGADLDVESLQRGPDGTLWIGDEFGPFIVHADATGKVLDAPIALPDPDGRGELRAPQNPFNEETATLRIMNALTARGRARGSAPPVLSPESQLLVDKNPATSIDHRTTPPAGSGLAAAASEIIDVDSMHRAGYKVVPYTIDDETLMRSLVTLKVDGLISDRPDLLRAVAESHPEFLDADGLIDVTKIDMQGHRGGRDLRPENTLPAFEVALDEHMTTLELDIGISSDGEAIIGHDPIVNSQKCRRADGAAYAVPDEVLVSSMTRAALQATFVCDKLFRGLTQKNDAVLSPVASAFATTASMSHMYVKPTLQQLFDFVDSYVAYYESGAGNTHPDAVKRAKNARRVRFNIETKVNPRTEYAARTTTPEVFVNTIAGLVDKHGLRTRATLQSFDARSIVLTQDKYPWFQTVMLLGDFPVFADRGKGTDDSTNLQPEGANTPWLAGMTWPYRQTQLDRPFRVQSSGGLEGMAISPSGDRLLPLLEKPLSDATSKTLVAFEYDLKTRAFTANRWAYPMDPQGTSVAEFSLLDDTHGLVIERDDKQGDLTAFKSLTAVTLAADGTIAKRQVTDLMKIADPRGISASYDSRDVGVGATFAMPFVTIESFVVLDAKIPSVLVVNDNNFPFSKGRHVTQGKPDDTEFITIKTAPLF